MGLPLHFFVAEHRPNPEDLLSFGSIRFCKKGKPVCIHTCRTSMPLDKECYILDHGEGYEDWSKLSGLTRTCDRVPSRGAVPNDINYSRSAPRNPSNLPVSSDIDVVGSAGTQARKERQK